MDADDDDNEQEEYADNEKEDVEGKKNKGVHHFAMLMRACSVDIVGWMERNISIKVKTTRHLTNTRKGLRHYLKGVI